MVSYGPNITRAYTHAYAHSYVHLSASTLFEPTARLPRTHVPIRLVLLLHPHPSPETLTSDLNNDDRTGPYAKRHVWCPTNEREYVMSCNNYSGAVEFDCPTDVATSMAMFWDESKSAGKPGSKWLMVYVVMAQPSALPSHAHSLTSPLPQYLTNLTNSRGGGRRELEHERRSLGVRQPERRLCCVQLDPPHLVHGSDDEYLRQRASDFWKGCVRELHYIHKIQFHVLHNEVSPFQRLNLALPRHPFQ